MIPIVYDTGRLYPGGRCSSREVGPEKVLFDHSAQYLSVAKGKGEGEDEELVHNERWMEWVSDMKSQGVLREWTGAIGTLYKGKFKAQNKDEIEALIGKNGMRSIPLYLSEGLHIDRPKWVRTYMHTYYTVCSDIQKSHHHHHFPLL